MDSKQFICDECGASFTKNKNQLRHVRTVQRTDNEKRKREVADKVRKQGHLACTDIRTCEVPVESVYQAVFKSPADYVAVAMKTHEDKQLTVEEFMQTNGLSVFKHITDKFWTLLYERPDLYVREGREDRGTVCYLAVI